MTTALYAGSFDPPHLGHVDVIARAAAAFERVIVAVARNPDKRAFLPVSQRVELLTAICEQWSTVSITAFDGLTSLLARDTGADLLLRGLRGPSDLDHERPMAAINRGPGGIDTVFLLSQEAHYHISSGLVRATLAAGMPIDDLVPRRVAAAIARLET